MKEVQVLAWCDGCAAEIGDGDGQVERSDGEVTVALDGGKSVTLDLCERHRKTLVDPLAQLLTDYGAVVGVPAAPATRKIRNSNGPRLWLCLWCPTDYAAESGLRYHVNKVHGFPHTSKAFGLQCPLCNEKATVRLGMHGQQEHDAANPSQLFAMARDAGDPHGVVARRLRAGKHVER